MATELHSHSRLQVLIAHYMLVMQSARYLLKNLLGARSGRAPQGSASYLGNAKTEMKSKCEASSAKQWRDPAIQLAALRHVLLTAVHSLRVWSSDMSSQKCISTTAVINPRPSCPRVM